MRRMHVRSLLASVLALPLLGACSSSPASPWPVRDGGAGDVTRLDARSPSDSGSDAKAKSDVETPVPGAPALLQLDCDPMVPKECGYPFPSSVWTTPDPSMETGVHLYFGTTTLPLSQDSVRVSSAPLVTRDGFSPGATIVTYLDNAATTGLPNPDSIALSVTKTSPTILMEADTGALVPHFSELDSHATDSTQAAFRINPAIRMKDATRYIVAIRHVVDSSNNVIAANPVFAALRDNTPSSDISVPPRRALYADIMSKLSANGITTSDLQIAWDFTTASQKNTTSWLLTIRDAALAVVGAAGPSYTITSVDTNPNPYIAKRLHGMMTVPLYLTSPNVPASINFNDAGVPTQNGTAQFPFLVHIPNSLYMAGKAGPIIENAHGLLGDESEGVAVDLIGMANDDIGFVAQALGTDPTNFEQAIERQHQGLVNELLAIRMLMGGLATDVATQGMTGQPTIDPTQRFYRGDSQGGIFGGTFMSISTDVTRGLLGEPGAPYALILDRSIDFRSFSVFLTQAYPHSLDVQLNIALLDTLWDRTEPDGYIPYITTNMLPGTPSHNVLLEAALGDQEVSTLAAEFVARTIGAQDLLAVNQQVYGLTSAASGFTGNGLNEWSFNLPPIPLTNIPPSAGTDPHGELRYVTAEQDQADQFFRAGIVNQTCPDGGPCSVVGCDAGTGGCVVGP
jgi:hypothetical protein